MNSPGRSAIHPLAKHGEINSVSRFVDSSRHEIRSEYHDSQQQNSSTRISPPPLKRQRMETNPSIVFSKRPSLTTKSVRPSTCPSEADRSLTNSRHSISYSIPVNSHHGSLLGGAMLSTSGPIDRPDQSIRSNPPGKPTCRVCNKTSATKYNPIVVCPSCQRPYHDSCRKPPLVEGTDANYWRCQKCIGKTSNHKAFHLAVLRPPTFLSEATPVAHVLPESPIKATGYTVQDSKLPAHFIHISSNQFPVIPALHSVTEKAKSPTPHLPPGGIKHEEKKASEWLHKSLSPFENEQRVGSFSSGKPDVKVGRESSLSFLEPRTVNNALRLSTQHEVEGKERTEIPNTPTQQSSQTYTPDSSLQHQHTPNNNLYDTVGDHLLAGNFQPEQASFEVISCLRCQKRVFFAKKSDSCNAKCKKCRSRLSAAGVELLVIPETPDASSSTHVKIQTVSQDLDPTFIASTPNSTVSSISSLGPCHEYQKHLPKCVSSGEANNTNINNTGDSNSRLALPITITSAFKNLPNSLSLSATQATQIYMTPGSGSASTEKTFTNHELAKIALVAADGEPWTSTEIIDWIAQEFICLRRGDAWEKSVKRALSQSDEFKVSNIDGYSTRHQGVFAKHYVFASVSRRIQYKEFYSQYCTNTKSTSAVSVSRSAMNDDETIAQPPQTKNKTRCKVAIKSAPKQDLCDCVKAQHSHPLGIVARKSASATKTAVPAKPYTVTSFNVPTTATLLTEIQRKGPNSIPFQRSAPRQPRLGFNRGVRKNTGPQYWKPSIEVMTQVDIDQKIAEIKSRTSRKKFFGPDYRLAHVRRYERRDIHDERDGAWKANVLDKDIKMTRFEEKLTLVQAFSLPKSAIPTNDGQSELAFRDGTLMNGKLPRSRQIYKVGKVFVGELTIRTS